MSHRPLHGVIVPLAVPLLDDERLDADALRAHIDYLQPHVDGYLLLGSSGEYATLRSSVAREVVDVAIEHIGVGKQIVVGAGDTGTARAIDNARALEGLPIDAVAVTSGFYYPSTGPEELDRHFRSVADSSPLPVVLYNIPQNTAGNLTATGVARLASHGNIVGIKDSSGDMIQFENTIFGDLPDGFSVFTGREELVAVTRYLGGAGIVSGLANLAPWLLRDVLDAVDAGDRERAVAAQRAVNSAAQVFSHGHWLSALKAALADLGFGSGQSTSPLPRLDQRERSAVRAHVAQLTPPTGGTR